MADELTPQEQRELDAIDRALSGRQVDPEFEDLAALTNELHEMRATPSADYARDLDRRAAGWLAGAKPRRGRPSWLRAGLPAAAAAAAAVVIAVAVTGGGDGEDAALQLSAIQEDRRGALPLPVPKAESDPGGEEEHGHDGPLVGKELELERARVPAGQPIVVRYEVFRRTEATVQLAGEEGDITLQPGRGRLEIGTAGVAPGQHPLSIILQPGGSLHTTVAVRD